jgi:hypothetical protein
MTTEKMQPVQVRLADGSVRFVEYARFAGSRCEAVGFGDASLYDGRRRGLIRAALKRMGYTAHA